MPSYRYRAVNKAGTAVAGVMEADNLPSLEQLLQEIGYWLIDASTTTSTKATTHDARVSRRELIEFCSSMAAMLDAGIPVIDAMKTMAEETANQGFQAVQKELALSIEAGSSLTVAMERHPKVFSRQISNIVNAGEYSGNLGTAFSEVMRYLEWTDELIADLKQVSIYPVTVLIAVGLFVLVLFGFVVPTFTALLEEMDMTLPLVTRLVMSVGDFVSQHWLLLLGVPSAAWITVSQLHRRSAIAAAAIDRAKLRLPLFGDVLRMVSLSRFSHNMAMLMRSGVPILTALELTRDLVGNRLVSQAIAAAEAAVNEGQTMTSAFRNYDVFSPMIMRMLVVGEETGTMEKAFDHISTRFDQDVPRRIKRLMSILEPTIILGLIALVGTVAMAIFLPFMELIGGIL